MEAQLAAGGKGGPGRGVRGAGEALKGHNVRAGGVGGRCYSPMFLCLCSHDLVFLRFFHVLVFTCFTFFVDQGPQSGIPGAFVAKAGYLPATTRGWRHFRRVDPILAAQSLKGARLLLFPHYSKRPG